MDIKEFNNNNLVYLIKVLKKNNISSKDLLNNYCKYYTSSLHTKYNTCIKYYTYIKYTNKI